MCPQATASETSNPTWSLMFAAVLEHCIFAISFGIVLKVAVFRKKYYLLAKHQKTLFLQKLSKLLSKRRENVGRRKMVHPELCRNFKLIVC